MLSQRFPAENILDEVVGFPVLESELDNSNYSNINISLYTQLPLNRPPYQIIKKLLA